MSLLESIKAFYASSIGKKCLVALSGIVLLVFLFGHMTGNLLIFLGRDALNNYGDFLQNFMHGAGLWMARLGLLVALIIHVIATVHLTRQNCEARQERYAMEATQVASKASRTMMITGVVILLFVVYHVFHFTIAPTPGPDEVGYNEVLGDEARHDVYHMVVTGFSNWVISGFYIVSMAFVCFHVSHGFSSVFQTLGFRTEKSWPLIRAAGLAYALVIFAGNVSIPLSVLFGLIQT